MGEINSRNVNGPRGTGAGNGRDDRREENCVILPGKGGEISVQGRWVFWGRFDFDTGERGHGTHTSERGASSA